LDTEKKRRIWKKVCRYEKKQISTGKIFSKAQIIRSSVKRRVSTRHGKALPTPFGEHQIVSLFSGVKELGNHL
jgi:hypothetical protein